MNRTRSQPNTQCRVCGRYEHASRKCRPPFLSPSCRISAKLRLSVSSSGGAFRPVQRTGLTDSRATVKLRSGRSACTKHTAMPRVSAASYQILPSGNNGSLPLQINRAVRISARHVIRLGLGVKTLFRHCRTMRTQSVSIASNADM